MDQEKHTETFMTKLSRFIVDKRKAFYLAFLAAFLFCAASINKVEINNDITSYLPPETETRRGLTLMDEEFVTLGSADVMVSNIPLDTAWDLSHKLEILPGVSGVTFDETDDHYRDSAALFSITFDAPEDDPEAVTALQAVQDTLEGYDVYVSTQVGRDESASLQKEMTVILAIAAAVIVVVLLFTSKSYMEVPVYLIVFSAAAVLNMGTNFIFGTISFITNSIAVVLQLALAIDYAIIFCHRYMEERDNGLDPREADIAALSKAIVEISSSSLTTISGLVALMLMQLRIGFDMGIVLAKGIVCSMLCVFLLMPGLLMLFSRPIEKTRHKNLVPNIDFWGRGVIKLRYVLPPSSWWCWWRAPSSPTSVSTSLTPTTPTLTTSPTGASPTRRSPTPLEIRTPSPFWCPGGIMRRKKWSYSRLRPWDRSPRPPALPTSRWRTDATSPTPSPPVSSPSWPGWTSSSAASSTRPTA